MDAQTLKQQIAATHGTARADEGHWLGMAAFRYGFPLLEMHRSLWEWHVDASVPTHLGAINEIHHTPRRAEPKDTCFVTPIVDAPYSRTFVDLSGGAVVLTVPDGITRVITAPTPPICLLARVTILDDDVPAAVALQKRIALRPADPAAPEPDPSANPPARDWRGEGGDPLDFYRMLADCPDASPPPAADAGVLGLLARIGITPHPPFGPSRLHPAPKGSAVRLRAARSPPASTTRRRPPAPARRCGST
ncbi:DUF1254 domain-containing protein [Streptomyces sp. SID2131]|nr:DUF1254 domain-containing protein [Streptomyces sp. SID2131]